MIGIVQRWKGSAMAARLPFMLCSMVLAVIAVASEAPEPLAQSAPSNAAPVCMVRDQGDGALFHIILPANYQATLAEAGYEPTPCGERFDAPAERAYFRDSVCWIASIASEGAQQRYAADHGVRANILCGLAEVAVGRWKRR